MVADSDSAQRGVHGRDALRSRVALEILRNPSLGQKNLIARVASFCRKKGIKGASSSTINRIIAEFGREGVIEKQKKRYQVHLSGILGRELLIRAYVGVDLKKPEELKDSIGSSEESDVIRYLRETEKIDKLDNGICIRNIDLIFSGAGNWDFLIDVVAVELRTLRDWVLVVGENVGETSTMVVALSG